MDLSLDLEEYCLNIRVGVILRRNNEILLHKDTRKNSYTFPGGRVMLGEESSKTAIREVKEETGKEIEICQYFGTLENFFSMEGKKYHEILFLWQGNMKEMGTEKIIKNIEGKDYLEYEWVAVEDLPKRYFQPTSVIEKVIQNSAPFHLVQKD